MLWLERETVLGDGAAMRDADQASVWNSAAEESSSGRAEGCPRTFCVRASACKTLASPQLWCTVLSTVLVNRQHSCCLHAQVYCPNGLSIGSSLAIAAE